jgi:hypothetical protein
VKVIKRAQWKAAPPKERTKLNPKQIDELVVHYTSMGADQVKSHTDCSERVRATQRYHQSADPSRNKKPWSDISYNFVFCHHGGIFEGRGWDVMSAATLGHNDHTQAICFLGGDREGHADFTPEAEQAALTLIEEFHRRYGADKKVVCHGDRSAAGTSCPGNEIGAWVRRKGWAKRKPASAAATNGGKAAVEAVPEWLMPWVEWQLGDRDPAKRPKKAPKKIPAFAWDVLRSVQRLAKPA